MKLTDVVKRTDLEHLSTKINATVATPVLSSDEWDNFNKIVTGRSPLEDMWDALVKDAEAEIKKSHKDSDETCIRVKTIKDRNMNLNNSNLRVIKIEETEKEAKVPQHKTAPKKVTRKVVKVTFASGNTQEAVCLEEDAEKYNLREAIQVCILKEIFGGTKAYNDFLRKVMKDYKKRLEAEKKKQEDEEIAARRKAKNDKRKAKLEAKKKEAKRQEKIDIQAAAFLKALIEYDKFIVQEDIDQIVNDFVTAEDN